MYGHVTARYIMSVIPDDGTLVTSATIKEMAVAVVIIGLIENEHPVCHLAEVHGVIETGAAAESKSGLAICILAILAHNSDGKA